MLRSQEKHAKVEGSADSTHMCTDLYLAGMMMTNIYIYMDALKRYNNPLISGMRVTFYDLMINILYWPYILNITD